MLDKETFEKFFPSLPVRIVVGLDRECNKNNIIYFKIKNKCKLDNVKYSTTKLLIDFSRDSATLGVHDINSYEEFIGIEKNMRDGRKNRRYKNEQ